MEVVLAPEVQAKLDEMVRETGRPEDQLIADAVTGLYDELAQTREMLSRRYEDLASGRVAGIDGEEAYRLLMEKTDAER